MFDWISVLATFSCPFCSTIEFFFTKLGFMPIYFLQSRDQWATTLCNSGVPTKIVGQSHQAKFAIWFLLKSHYATIAKYGFPIREWSLIAISSRNHFLVIGHNSIVNSVCVDDWTAEFAITSSNDMSTYVIHCGRNTHAIDIWHVGCSWVSSCFPFLFLLFLLLFVSCILSEMIDLSYNIYLHVIINGKYTHPDILYCDITFDIITITLILWYVICIRLWYPQNIPLKCKQCNSKMCWP